MAAHHVRPTSRAHDKTAGRGPCGRFTYAVVLASDDPTHLHGPQNGLMRSQCMQPNPNPHTSHSTGRWGWWREVLGRLGVSLLRASTARHFSRAPAALVAAKLLPGYPETGATPLGRLWRKRDVMQDRSRPSPTASWLDPVLPRREKLTLRQVTTHETTTLTAVQGSNSPRRVSTGVPVGLARGRCASMRIHLVMCRRQLNNTSWLSRQAAW